MKDELNLPEAGRLYNCYDDGKIKESRRYTVVVLDVVPWEEVDKWDKEEIVNRIKNSCHLFKIETDYVIYGISYEQQYRPRIEIFIRTRENGWFGIGENGDSYWCSGELDVDGSLTKKLSIN